MKSALQSFVGSSLAPSAIWDIAFHGTVVDDRGLKAVEIAKSVSALAWDVSYDADELLLHLEGEPLEPDLLSDRLTELGVKTMYIEATTLGFAEILLAVKASRDAGLAKIRFCYAEPGEYVEADEGQGAKTRQFGLSNKVIGYKAIPGSAVILDESDSQHAVFFLGYEGDRLDRAFEELKLVSDNCGVVFGVPAYKPGWETNAFVNNARVIKDRKIGGGVDFCAATSPLATIQLLEERLKACKHDAQLIVAPIGTKPHGIGVAIFADLHREVGILFDHPTRREGRSREVHQWHWHDYLLSEAPV
jgi:hypothetical protein